MLQMTKLTVKRPRDNNTAEKDTKVNVNFYVTKLNDENKKVHGYCLVIQPIIIIKNEQSIS